MMKLFALLSVLFFVFKALADDEKNSGPNFNEVMCFTVNELRGKCANDKDKSAEFTVGGQTHTVTCGSLDNQNCPAAPAEDRFQCKATYDKMVEKYENFKKDQRTERKDALKDREEKDKAIRESQKTCNDDIQKIQDQIKEESQKLKEDLAKIEEEIKTKDEQTQNQLQQAISAAKELSGSITRNLGTERTAVYTSFNSEVRKLATDCQKLLADAKRDAQEYLRQRRIGRNTGRIKQKSVNSSFNGDPDKFEAYLKITDTFEQCEFIKQNLQENRDLALDTLDESLQKLEADSQSLRIEINKINLALQNSPTEKQRKLNERLQISAENVESLTKQLMQLQQFCAQEQRALSQEASALSSLAIADENKEALSSYYELAAEACCDPKNNFNAKHPSAKPACTDLKNNKRKYKGSSRSRSR